jgi:protein ImuB
MLWISLYFPQLSIQLIERSATVNVPLVIAEGPQNRPIVFDANATAINMGVKVGMPTAAANALVNELQIILRDPEKEIAAMDNLAGWASQFTPSVAIQPPNVILMEVMSTLTLHRGLPSLLNQLKQGLDSLGYNAKVGVAPTAMAAWLLAKARHYGHRTRSCTSLDNLPERLGGLPIKFFDWPTASIVHLESLGVATIAQCMALPRDGFIHRFGDEPLVALDKALGKIPDPRLFFSPPEQFAGSVDFGFEIVDAMALLFPLKRLLSEMEGFLRGRGAGVQEWRLLLVHSKAITQLQLGVATPERDANRLLALAKERLAQLALTASVIGIHVLSGCLLPFELDNQSWLPDPQRQGADWLQLLDTLVARLGPDKVFCLGSIDDHRPEAAWKKIPASKKPALSVAPKPIEPRPLYLLPAPRVLLSDAGGPLCRGQLHIITTPERLETAWWANASTGRDYYIARNDFGETMWIFRDHHGDKRWYLHGYFA